MSENKKETHSNFLKAERERVREYRKQKSNIPEHYFSFSWSDYALDYDQTSNITDESIRKSRETAKVVCASYAKEAQKMSENGKSLFIFGRRTSGKTVLATLILRTVIDKCIGSVFYTSFSKFAMEANTATIDDSREILEEKYTAPLFLLIDEVDEIESNQRINNHFGNILLLRQEMGLPTIITSKISLGKIKTVYGNLAYSAISNREFFLPPLIIKTNEGGFTDTVYIEDGRSYNIEAMIRLLDEKKESLKRANKKNKNIMLNTIRSNDLKEIIVGCDRANSIDEKF